LKYPVFKLHSYADILTLPDLELENLVLVITELLEQAADLPLRPVGGLASRDAVHHPRGAANHDDAVLGGGWEVSL